MARIRNESPLRRLRNRVASIAELRSMTDRERKDATCRICQITYRSKTDAQACQRWHLGQGT